MSESESFKAVIQQMVKKAALDLGEHVDTVQIFVSKYSPEGDGNSLTFEIGNGSYYARFGQVQEWLTIQEEYQRCWARDKDAEESD